MRIQRRRLASLCDVSLFVPTCGENMFGDDECFRVSDPKLVHAWTFSKNLFESENA